MLLFVDACMREESRTLQFAHELMPRFGKPDITRCLRKAPLFPTTYESTMERNLAAKNADWLHPLTVPAREFAAADEIVIAAPYWNLGFPALFGAYLEHICAVDITFRYDENNRVISLCRAKSLHYISTAGGEIPQDEWFGYRYLCGLCKNFFQIPVVTLHTRHGLDLPDSAAELQKKADL